jgi:hypothetical protein
MRRHVEFGCGISSAKAPLAYYGIGFHFLGEVPSKIDVMSESSARYSFIQLKLADNAFDSILLNKTFLQFPNAAISFCFDGTKEATDTRQSLFMRAPFLPTSVGAYPVLRTIFLGFSVSPSKGAKSNAEMTMHLIKEWAQFVPGLYIRILIAFVWSVVDHAALPECKDLSTLAGSAIERYLIENKMSLSDIVGDAFPASMRAWTGDSFHKSSLVSLKAETSAFGNDRGGKDNDVYSPTQVCLDAHYYECRGEGRFNLTTRLEAYMGFKVPIMKALTSQRWENNGKVMNQVLERTLLESHDPDRKNCFAFPDWHIDEIRLYTESQYQYKLLMRTIAGFSDPRFVLAQLKLPCDILLEYWKPANLVDRSRSIKTGAGQGFGMRSFYEHMIFVSSPYWENAHQDLSRYVPLTYQGLDDLRNYAHWTYTNMNDEEKRFSVIQCVAIERAHVLNENGGVRVSETWVISFRDMELYDEEEEWYSPIKRQPFLIQNIHAHRTVASNDGEDVENFDEDLSVMNINQYADFAQRQVVIGLLEGRTKFRELHQPYFRAPQCLHLLTVPGISGAAARFFISLVKRHNPSLLLDFEITDFDDEPNSWDTYFSTMLVPTPAELAKRVTLIQNEVSVVSWMARFGLLNKDFSLEWNTLCHVTASRHSDPANDFCSSYPLLHVCFGYTIDLLSNTDYVCEQSNALLTNLVEPGSSLVKQDVVLDYFFNVLSPINDACRLIGTSKEEVDARRGKGAHVRLRAVDTHEKRRMQVLLAAQVADRYTSELMSLVPTREYIAQKGTGAFNSIQKELVLAVAAEKRQQHPMHLDKIYAAISSLQDVAIKHDEDLWAEITETPQDTAVAILMTPNFWHNVPNNIIFGDVKWVLPHAHTLMRIRTDVITVLSTRAWASPSTSLHLWTGDDDSNYPDGWCFTSCARKHEDDGSMIYCERASCNRRCFHLSCVGLTRAPVGHWFCPTCSVSVPQWTFGDACVGATDSFSFERSIIWDRKEKYSKTTRNRQSTPAFFRRQIKAYVVLILGGRSIKRKGLSKIIPKEEPAHFPKKECPFCKCRHAGGIRCYLQSDEDSAFLSAFVRPFGTTIKGILKAKMLAKQGLALGTQEIGLEFDPQRDEEALGGAFEME